ncbi:MAG: ATP-binding cassette domain-containing protein, partial [Firmicutes bacterium]|nr:ATP-binding cassette domain-containing protein [Bacillota bacterium]
NLLPGLNALENVQLAAELSKDPFNADELLDAVGLGDRKTAFPSTMSGGQQQRVAIARALCKNPDLLLCDEPTGALDSKTSVQVLKLLWDFNRKYKKAILMVTHNADIAKIADRVFYFKDGMIDHIDINKHPLDPEDVDW